ncbi:MAG: hypothetical protein WA099_12645 [Sulfuricurvum sp.]
MIKESGKVYQNGGVAVISLAEEEEEGFTVFLTSAKLATKSPILVDMQLGYGDNLYITTNRYACINIRNIFRQFALGRINKFSDADKFFAIKEKDGVKSLMCKFVKNKSGENIFIDQSAAQNITYLWDLAMSGYSITHIFSTQKKLTVISTSRDWMEEQWWTWDEGIIRDKSHAPTLPQAVRDSLNKIIHAKIIIE